MTEYAPYQEPQGEDVRVLTRQAWDEFRRISLAVEQANPADLQQRLATLEALVQLLMDGVYGIGTTDDALWAPNTTTPTTAARIPIERYDVQSNVTMQPFSITPLFSADYAIDIRLHFEPDGTNRTWNVGVFVNGVQAGNGYAFNNRDNPELIVTGLFGAHLDANDEIDVRLWPNAASDTGTIRDYTYSLRWLGLDEGVNAI